jgi:hypothetical protein
VTTTPLGNQTTRQLPASLVAHGRHGQAGSLGRAVRAVTRTLPRPTLRGTLTVAGLAELAAAVGWGVGYGWSPSGAVMAFNAALLLLIAAGVRS